MTILVVADQHLGAGASLGNRLADQRASWERFCASAVELNATVLHAGDVFHNRRPGMAEMDAFQSGLDILREGDVTLLGIAGNHDVRDRDLPTAFEVACSGYDAHVFREAQVVETPDGLVGLLPWMPPVMSAKQTAEALMIVAESLAEQGAKILVGHWALSAASLPTGLPVLELAEPILDSHRLAELFDVVLMGHIHKPQVVIGERNEWPHVLHTGPLSRGNFGEASVATGAWRVEPDGGDGITTYYKASWISMPDRAFLSVDVDVRDLHDLGAAGVLEVLGEQDIEGAIVRVAWRQTADQVVEQDVILDYLNAEHAHYVDALTPIIERPQSTRSENVTEHLDPREAWDVWQAAQDALASEDVMAAVRAEAHSRIGAA